MRAAKLILLCLCLGLIIKAPIHAQRPEIVAQTGHADGMGCFAISADNQLLVSGDLSGTVKLWDTQSGLVLRTIAAHDGVVTALAFNADGEVFASESRPGFSAADGAGGGMDGTVKLWHVRTGKLLAKLDFAAPQLAHFAFSPDGKLLATGAKDNTIKVWDAHTGRLLQTLTGHTRPVGAVVFSPNGKLLASSNKYGLSADGFEQPCEANDPKDNTRIWDLQTGTQVFKMQGCGQVYFTSNSALTADEKGNIYDTKSGKLQRSLTGSFVAFNPDGGRALLSTAGHSLNVVEVETGKVLHKIAVSKGLQGEKEITPSPDGRTLVISDLKTIGGWDANFEVWDIFNGRMLYRIKGYSFEGFSPDGDRLVTYRYLGDSKATWDLYDTFSGRALVHIEDDSSVLGFSPDGKLMLTQDEDSLKLQKLPSGELWGQVQNGGGLSVVDLTFSPDKKMLAVSRSGRYELWDTHSGNLTRTFDVENPSQDGVHNAFGFTPDGELLGTGDGRLWNVQNGSLAHTFAGNVFLGLEVNAIVTEDHIELRNARTNALLRQVNESNEHGVALSPDGKLLAVSKDQIGLRGLVVPQVNIYDVASGRMVRNLRAPTGSVTRMIFSPDGRMLVVTIAQGNRGSVWNFLFDVRSGVLLTDFGSRSTDKIDGIVRGPILAFSPDSKMVVMPSRAANMVEFREVPSGKRIKTLTVGTATQYYDALGRSAAFSPDGKILVTGEAEAAIKFWSVTGGELLATVLSSKDGNWIVFTPDGLFDGSPNGWDQMLWRFGGDSFNVAPAEIYFNEFYYPGLLSDIFAGQRPKATQDIARKDRRQPRIQMSVLPSSEKSSMAQERTSRTVDLLLRVSEADADKDHQQGSGAQDVRLFRNGSLVKVWKGDVLKGGHSVELEVKDIAIIAGDNLFQAYAFNRDNIKSADAKMLVKGADSLKRDGIAYILAIGVNEYASPQFSNLRYAVADAQAFSAEFKRQQELLGQYARVKVTALQDQDATKTNILRALEQLSINAQPEDVVIVYFAGHGTAENNRFYLIPHDIGSTGAREAITVEDVAPILQHGISDVELQQGFEKMDAGQILLVIDACNSGQALEDEERRRGPMNSKGLAQLAYEKGMYILTAAQGYQAALEETRLGHGVLTYALVEEGLKTPAADISPKDGELILREWLDYSTQRVPQMQEESLRQGRAARSKVVWTSVARKLSMQRPRVFYRRELETRSLVIARIRTTQPPK